MNASTTGTGSRFPMLGGLLAVVLLWALAVAIAL